ncbi:MAG: hypothetical protein WCQ77_14575, partial [Planctomycetota bacterium]
SALAARQVVSRRPGSLLSRRRPFAARADAVGGLVQREFVPRERGADLRDAAVIKKRPKLPE